MNNELLTKFKEENKYIYYLMKIIHLNENNLVGKNLSVILEKQLFLIIFNNLDNHNRQKIIELKLKENKLVYNIFIENGFWKVPYQDEYIFAKKDDNVNLIYTVKKIGNTFKALADFNDNYLNRLLKYYENDLNDLSNLIELNNAIFCKHQIEYITNINTEYYDNVLSMIDILDKSRTMPNNKITQFLENYNPSKRLKKTRN